MNPRAELARRELARRQTIHLLRYTYPSYIVKPVHEYISKIMDKFIVDYEAGLAPKVHISMPPQHGKSTVMEAGFARLIARNLSTRIAWTGYSGDLPEKSSGIIRDILSSDKGQRLFPGALPPDLDKKKSVKEWETGLGGGLIARGVGGALTGRPVDVLGCDDLMKDYEEYCSRAIRRKTRNWIETVAGTRLHNHSAVFSIGTRWGAEDAIEMLMDIIPGPWEQYAIPAIAKPNDILGRKPGEPLFPERHSYKRLKFIERKIGPIKYGAIYDQNAMKRMGEFFRDGKWDIVEPGQVPLVIQDQLKKHSTSYWDLGFKKDGHPSANAKGIVLEDAIWLSRVKRITDTAWPDTKMIIKQTAKADTSRTRLAGEATTNQAGYWMEIAKELHKEGCHCRVIPRESKPDKLADAEGWQSEQWGGNVHLVNGPWVSEFLERAKLFNEITDIDEIDAISGLVAVCRKHQTREYQDGDVEAGETLTDEWDDLGGW